MDLLNIEVAQARLRSVVIKPIGAFCNLRCEYCFYLDKQELYEGSPSTHRMTDETLEALIKGLFNCSDQPTFTWQGGEPTILGIEFFKKVVALQKRYHRGKPYANALQTAGHLLNEEWADFLKRENFLVGVSMDGSKHIHDRYRKDIRGKGTFDIVLKNAKMLLNKGVDVNILASVNDYSVKYPKEIYDFFVDNGFNFMQFSPVVELHPDKPDLLAAPFSVNAKDYGRFLYRLFKRWQKDFDHQNLKQKTSIRFFDSIMKRYIGMTPDHCVLHQKCNQYLVIEHNGDLYSCDFMVSPATHLGNLHQTSLHDAFNSEAHVAFGAEKSNYGEMCEQCDWLKYCYGGCVKDRVRDPRDKGHNHFCESYKYFFERADSTFKKFAEAYKQHYT